MTLPKDPRKISASSDYSLCNQTLTLLPERAIFWQEKRYLLLSDTHLGKAAHFRKHGAPIPRAIHDRDLAILTTLIKRWLPDALVILGDLFHSALNNEWLDFEQWLQQHKQLPVVLIKGNHDILPEVAYHHSNLTIRQEAWQVAPFLLTHQPVSEPILHRGDFYFPKLSGNNEQPYNLAGHVHPGIRVSVGVGQYVKLPCFYFTDRVGLLPAFGQFTGCATMRQGVEERVFAVFAGNGVMPLLS